MLTLRVHNILDYVVGFVLLVSPYVFGFSDVGAARNLFLVLGFGIIAYSLLTDYPISLLKLIPVGWHMALDVLLGVSLILGAYVFGYNDLLSFGQMVVHYAFGIGAIALVAMTQPKPTKPEVAEREDIDQRAA